MLKATKTEYRDIVFDSRSESIFARAMDLEGLEWEYHPALEEPARLMREWDFLILADDRFAMLVEYKPCRTTKTYKEEILKKEESNEWFNLFAAAIVSGSPYRKDFSGYECEIIHDPWPGGVDGVDLPGRENAILSRDYRFDLDSGIHKESPGIEIYRFADWLDESGNCVNCRGFLCPGEGVCGFKDGLCLKCYTEHGLDQGCPEPCIICGRLSCKKTEEECLKGAFSG